MALIFIERFSDLKHACIHRAKNIVTRYHRFSIMQRDI